MRISKTLNTLISVAIITCSPNAFANGFSINGQDIGNTTPQIVVSPVVTHETLPQAPLVSGEDVQDQFVTFMTPFDNNKVENYLLQLINTETTSIWGNAYALTDQQMADALVEAEKRGVRIHLTVDSTQAAGSHQKPIMKELQDSGICVLTGKSPIHNQLLHGKFLVFHQEVVWDGSFNFTGNTAESQLNTVNIVSSTKRADLFYYFWVQIYNDLARKQMLGTLPVTDLQP